jgi:hypothetical protein
MMLKLARAFTILALVSIALTWIAALAVGSRAVLAQRVDPHPPDLAALLGEAGTPIGSPQQMIFFDDRVFLPGTGPSGSRLVSETYLTQNNIYPLQLLTVEFFRNAVSIGAGIAALLFGALWWWLSRTPATRRAPRTA